MLSQADVPIQEHDYFREPFNEESLRSLLAGRPAADIFSWRSPTARKLGLAQRKSELSDDELIRLMVEEPNLIKRPLLVVGGELIAGFDPQAQARVSELTGKTLDRV